MFKAELFSCPTEKKEAVPRLKIPYFLAKEGAHCDYLVLWLDCDKEGENICFEVIYAVQQGMNRRLNPNVDFLWIVLLTNNLIVYIVLMEFDEFYIYYVGYLEGKIFCYYRERHKIRIIKPSKAK